MTRRDLSLLLPALSFGAAARAQTESAAPLAQSAAYQLDQLPAKRSPGGAVTHPVLNGKLPTGETVEIHESTLEPGQMPHPAHQHVHTEFILIREGTIEFQMNDKTERLGPGGIAMRLLTSFTGSATSELCPPATSLWA